MWDGEREIKGERGGKNMQNNKFMRRKESKKKRTQQSREITSRRLIVNKTPHYRMKTRLTV